MRAVDVFAAFFFYNGRKFIVCEGRLSILYPDACEHIKRKNIPVLLSVSRCSSPLRRREREKDMRVRTEKRETARKRKLFVFVLVAWLLMREALKLLFDKENDKMRWTG